MLTLTSNAVKKVESFFAEAAAAQGQALRRRIRRGAVAAGPRASRVSASMLTGV